MEKHSTPIEGSSCACCWDDLDESSYVEYRASAGSDWLPSGFCKNCVELLLASQYETYVSTLAKSTCKAEQRRMLKRGPPVNLSDKAALPCPEDGEVHSLWYMADKQVKSAKLEGSLEGEERQRYWNELNAFHITDEVGEDDEEKSESK